MHVKKFLPGISNTRQVGLLIGMLTGAKHKIDRFQRAEFCESGVAHIFAVSGLHIGLIAFCLDRILRILLIPKKIRAFPVVIILFIYINIIGPMPSSVRACLMVMFYYLSILFDRQPNVLAAFANSSLLHILYCPTIVYNISFLLSYCVVFGIISLGQSLNVIAFNRLINNELHPLRSLTILQKIYRYLKKYFLENFCISLAACATSLIISMEFFGQISYLTILFNLIVIPLAYISIILGSLSILCGMFHALILCKYINNLAILPIILVEKCFDITRILHHGAININCPIRGLWLLILPILALIGYFILHKTKYLKRADHYDKFCSANSCNFCS